MRILAVTEHFPPHYVGGYELACGEVMARLARRGHEVLVYTSDYRNGLSHDTAVSDHLAVERSLPFRRRGPIADGEAWWRISPGEVLRERSVRMTMERAIRRFRPEVISIWRLWSLPPSVLSACLNSGIPVVAAVSDEWIAELSRLDISWFNRWKAIPRAGWRRLVKRACRPVVRRLFADTELRLDRLAGVHFFSRFLLDAHAADLSPGHAAVIHHGIDLREFPFLERKNPGLNCRILYVGRLHPTKGIETAIRALALLGDDRDGVRFELDLVGSAREPEYEASLRELVRTIGVEDRVRFLGGRTREQVVGLFQDYDLFVFPSIWQEPFSIVLVEAMASGLPVVSTLTGGTPELVRPDENAVAFEAGDPDSLATQVRRMASDPGLRERLRREARKTVESMCDLEVNSRSIEEFLQAAAGCER